MHTLKIAVLEAAPRRPLRGADRVGARPRQARPDAARRLALGPGRIGRPYWAEGERFDRPPPGPAPIAAPGGRRELCGLVGRAAEAPLLDRPSSGSSVSGLPDRRSRLVQVHPASPTASRSPASSPAGSRPSWRRRSPAGEARAGSGSSAGCSPRARASNPGTSIRPRGSGRAAPPAPETRRRRSAAGRSASRRVRLRAAPARGRSPGAQGARRDVSTTSGRADRRSSEGLPARRTVSASRTARRPDAGLAASGRRTGAGRQPWPSRRPCCACRPTIADPVARVGAQRVNAKHAKAELAGHRGARIDDAVDLPPRGPSPARRPGCSTRPREKKGGT